MRVEADPNAGVSAKTVGQLRKVAAWPDNLAIAVPQGRFSGSVVMVSKVSVCPGTSHCCGGGGTDLWPSAWRAGFWSTTWTGLGARVGGGFSHNECSGCGPRVTWTVCGT